MSVFRVNATKNYTVMSNIHFRDKRLSLKAKGLLSQMLSLPDSWDYTVAGLVSINKESKAAIQSTLKELEECGYLVRTRTKNERGQFDYIYDIYEKPCHGKPQTENQFTDNPCTENVPQLNTNNEILNNKLLKDKTNKDIREINKEILKEEFERLWSKYPRKQGKEAALNAYIKARSKKDYGKLNEYVVLEGIKRYTEYIEKNKILPQYVKQGSTWFNQYCWEDDYSATTPGNDRFYKSEPVEDDLPF